jgi:hypothetical protein
VIGIGGALNTIGLGTYNIWNNIVYNFTGGSNANRAFSVSGGASNIVYLYNNTAYGSNFGFVKTSGVVLAKNNLAQGNTF